MDFFRAKCRADLCTAFEDGRLRLAVRTIHEKELAVAVDALADGGAPCDVTGAMPCPEASST